VCVRERQGERGDQHRNSERREMGRGENGGKGKGTGEGVALPTRWRAKKNIA